MSVVSLDYLNKPDKRKKKTSLFQYKLYLKALEEDEIFRTGFIPPGNDSNYLSLKWKELADKLNEDEKGPKLSAEEWKKRLMDWKHTTRAKERRITEGNTHLRMTPLELRFMELWGCVPPIINISSIKDNADIKIEKSNDNDDTDKDIFEEELEQSEPKQKLEIMPHEIQLLTTTPQTQLTLSVPTSTQNDVNVVEQIQIKIPDKKIQNASRLIEVQQQQQQQQQQITVTNNSIQEKQKEITLATPPPLKRMRSNNIPQTHTITHIPISIASTQDYTHETSNINTNPTATISVSSNPIPGQITSRENLHLLHQTLNAAPQTSNLSSEIAYTINTLPQDGDPIPVIDVQSIASQIKRLAEVKEQKLRFEIEKFKFKNPGFKYDY